MTIDSNLDGDPTVPARRVWGVGALCRAVADALQSRFNPVAVKGEISGFTRASSGHCYFSVKDAEGQLRCAMFKRAASQIQFEPRDGDLVEVFGRLGVYESRGELQLVVESMRRAGQGSLYEQFLKRKAALLAQGLFDEERKRAAPLMPRRIGVVTSSNAAALHDVCTTLSKRFPHIEVIISPATVQGAEAPASLISALRLLYALERVDVILLVRGGGSMEDLWAFNDEGLARTIVESPVPLICGVGHETDFTIADFCADVRAPTPTAAAQCCATALDQLMGELDSLGAALIRRVNAYFERSQQQIDYLQDKMGRPSARMHAERTRLVQMLNRMSASVQRPVIRAQSENQALSAHLSNAVSRSLQIHKDRLQRAQIRAELLDPSLVLKRGYARLSDHRGVPITQAARLSAQARVQAFLSDGEADLIVEAVRLNV